MDHYRRALEATLGVPFVGGNDVRVLKNGKEIFPSMLEAIDQARRTIDFLTFVYWTGDVAERFAEALAVKARQGVDVDVILDAYGAKKMNRRLVRMMQDAGVDVTWFRPRTWRIWKYDNRTHRKVLVCDGRVGFTGGVGIAKEWDGDARNPSEWRDTHFRIEGPAVHGIHAAFVGNWAEMGRSVRLKEEEFPEIPPVGDAWLMPLRSVASIGWSDMATLMQVLVQLARQRIRITTPYFIPDDDTRQLLCSAARRGVEVQVLVPGPHIDHELVRAAAEDNYAPMLDAGVEIRRYLPTMLHAKVYTVDGALACVGSANFNHRSLRKDDEFTVAIAHEPTVATLDGHFEQDCEHAERVSESDWRERGLLQRMKESATRLVEPEL